MEYVAAEEEKAYMDGKEVLHSFHPQSWPDDVSQIPMKAAEELSEIKNASDSDGKMHAMHRARRFLPCHYFDFICGSSTGA